MRWLIALLLVPLAAAGSHEDPEVPDDLNDQFLSEGETDPMVGWDIEYAFFSAEGCDAGEDLVWLGVQNILENNQGNPGVVFTQTIHFTVAGSDHSLVARGMANPDGAADPTFTLQPAGTAVDGQYFNANDAPEGARFCLPHAAVGQAGDVVTQIWAETMVEEADGSRRHQLDVAPDDAPDAYGRDWMLGGFPVLPDTHVTAATARVMYEERLELAFDVRNDGEGDAVVELANRPVADWSQALSHDQVTIAPGSNQTVWLNVTFTGDTPDFPDVLFHVDWNDGNANGTATVHVEGPDLAGPNPTDGPEAPDPGDDTTTGDATGNGTGNATVAPGEDSPLPLLVAVGALLLAARRRTH